MAKIEWTSAPPIVATSRNPNRIKLKVFPFGDNERQVNTRVMLKVIVEQGILTDNWHETQEFSLYPDQYGNVEMDIHSLIDSVLQFDSPDINETVFQIATRQSGRYRVLARLIDDYQQLQTLELLPSALYAIKGGVSRESGSPPHYLQNGNILQASLDFNNEDEELHKDDLRWLTLFCNGNIFKQFTLKVDYTYKTEDAPSQIQTITVHPPDSYLQFGQVFRVPYGISKMGLPENTIYLNVKVTLEATGTGAQTLLLDRTFSNFNPHHNYDAKYLFFHNSLGAFSTLRLTGKGQFSGDYSKQSVTKINNALFESRNVLAADDKMYNALEREQYEVETGYVSKEKLMALRDLLRSEIAWTLQHNKRLVPVNIQPEKYAIYQTTDDLYSLAIKYELAFEDANYSPHRELSETCPSIEYARTEQTSAKMLDLYWKLPDGYFMAEIKWNKVGGTANTEWTQIITGNEGVVKLFCDFVYSGAPIYPSECNVLIKIRVICKNSDPKSFGPTMDIYDTVFEAQPISVINGFADTYKGTDPRIITWQNGSQELTDLVHWDINTNSNFMNYRIMRMSASMYSLTVIGSQGGLFEILPQSSVVNFNVNGFYKLRYTPPFADFEGVDIADFSAQQKIGILITQYASAKMYIRVKGLQDNGNGYVGLPYLKLELLWDSIHNYPGARRCVNGTIKVYSDPLGLHPFPLGSMQLDVAIESVATEVGTVMATKNVTLTAGYIFPVEDIVVLILANGNAGYPCDPRIASSPDFYTIP